MREMLPRRRLSDRAVARPSTGARPRTSAARSASATIRRPRRSIRSAARYDHPEPVRRRRRLPADLGRRQSGADHRGAGAARRRPPRQGDRACRRGGPCLSARSPSSPAARAASAGPSPRRWPRPASTSRSPTSPTRRTTALARHRASSARSSRSVRSDIADLAGHAATGRRRRSTRFGRIDCLVNNAGIGAAVRGDLLDLKPENFDRVMASICAARLPQPGGGPRRCWRTRPRPADARSSPSPRSAPSWPRPSAPTTASPRPALSMWAKSLALRLAAEGIARVRGAAGHHPHRHDGRRRRRNTTR